jgi:hydrogenase-4 component E
MSRYVDLLLLAVLAVDFYLVASSRLQTWVRATALQGAVLALLPLASWHGSPAGMPFLRAAGLSAAALGVKVIVIPMLFLRAIRKTGVRREVAPSVSLHLSLLASASLVGASFWLAGDIVPPRPNASPLVAPVVLATLLIGCFMLVSRSKAIGQAIGYLTLENGVFVFGQSLAVELPVVVELGILLDLLVGVFVMGIAIHHISREFDHIDVDRLASLRD